jgi:hypothetical protein
VKIVIYIWHSENRLGMPELDDEGSTPLEAFGKYL